MIQATMKYVNLIIIEEGLFLFPSSATTPFIEQVLENKQARSHLLEVSDKQESEVQSKTYLKFSEMYKLNNWRDNYE